MQKDTSTFCCRVRTFATGKVLECYEQFACNETENVRNGYDCTPSKEVQDMLDDYKEH